MASAPTLELEALARVDRVGTHRTIRNDNRLSIGVHYEVRGMGQIWCWWQRIELIRRVRQFVHRPPVTVETAAPSAVDQRKLTGSTCSWRLRLNRHSFMIPTMTNLERVVVACRELIETRFPDKPDSGALLYCWATVQSDCET